MLTVQDTTCTRIFRHLTVDHLVRGITQVSWELSPNFRDTLPHTFQLQVGRTGLITADDWTDVGSTAVNVFLLVDAAQRLYGKTFWTHYRVKLTTPNGVYYSEPASVLGRLSCRDQRIYNEILRKEQVRHRYVSEAGYILKRRVYGAPCEACVDSLTEEVRDDACSLCFGTNIEGGYFAALPDQHMELGLESRHERLELSSRGTVNPMTIPGRFLGTPQLSEDDVFVHQSSDRRYYVHDVKSLAEIKGVPLITQISLRLIPATSPIYDFPLNGVGAGTEHVELVIEDEGGDPVAGAAVWITTGDDSAANLVAGPQITDVLGKVTFMLDPGTGYRRWVQLTGYVFDNPQLFDVA